MGKINLGILGSFSGKVGNVVGGNWKGISYMRAKATSVSNPRTDGQVNQRTKFALVLAILKPITGFLRVGYKKYAIKQTAFNAAMSYILGNAIAGAYPDFSVDMAKVLVSRGSLTGALNGVATSANGVVTLNWADNSGSGTAAATDKALILVLNPTRAESVFDTGGNQRVATTEDITVPADWVGESVEVFLGFITEDGKDVANSSYLGSVVVA
jgi:hypothetical protein